MDGEGALSRVGPDREGAVAALDRDVGGPLSEPREHPSEGPPPGEGVPGPRHGHADTLQGARPAGRPGVGRTCHHGRVAGRLYLGTSGFAYEGWRGTFFPEELPSRRMLAHYASRFGAVEVNATFRRFPSERALAGWRDLVPEGFVFALKAHQRITHGKRLADTDEDVAAFLERAAHLGEHRGPVLFQCPPSLRYDRRLIEVFLGSLPPWAKTVMEFRHPSWEEARPLLAEHGVAWCVAETDGRPFAGEVPAHPFAYLRLRKTAYAAHELAAWAGRLRSVLASGRDAYCFVKHDEAGRAPAVALQLAALLVGEG